MVSISLSVLLIRNKLYFLKKFAFETIRTETSSQMQSIYICIPSDNHVSSPVYPQENIHLASWNEHQFSTSDKNIFINITCLF